MIARILEAQAGMMRLPSETVWDGGGTCGEPRAPRRGRVGFIFRVHKPLRLLQGTGDVA